MKIYDDITALIGSTPLIRLKNYEKNHSLNAVLLAKAECFNPAGSAKDRIALHMINKAEKEGRLLPGATIIEPTSGNTGIGLAAVAASRGYKTVFTMPETMSAERVKLLKAYGAEIILTPGGDGMNGAIEKAKELNSLIPGSIVAGQFVNPENPEAHFLTTGPEIYEDTDGKVDIFVAGAGTGGTVSGTGRYLKSRNPKIKIAAFEPAGSPVISGGKAGAHGLQGIGAGFIPENLDTDIIDEVITVTDEEAYAAGRELAKCEGLLCGITSGAAVHTAALLASRPENSGKIIVALLPDTGERYLSTPLFE